jgi:hypothetical protein
MNESIVPAVPIVEVSEFEPTSSSSNQTVSITPPADMNSMRDWK